MNKQKSQAPKAASTSATPTQAPPPSLKPAPAPKRFIPSEAAKQIKHVKPKVGRNVFVCLLYAIIIFLLIAGVLLFGIAKTGLFNIPILSNFYKGPEPTRLVEAGVMDPDAFIDQISLIVSAAVRRGEQPPYAIPITEEDLTAAARGGLADAIRAEQLIAERPQIVVTPEYVEASGMFETEHATVDLLLQLIPVVREGELDFDITKAYLGDIPISPELAKSMESMLFTRDFGAWSVKIGNVALQDVHLKDGELELILDKAE